MRSLERILAAENALDGEVQSVAHAQCAGWIGRGDDRGEDAYRALSLSVWLVPARLIEVLRIAKCAEVKCTGKFVKYPSTVSAAETTRRFRE